ncbi:MAG: carbohydrate-binding protein, partial [Marinoscillum sp.]
NEPNDVPGGGQAIHALLQRLITTIRDNGDNHMIMVEGNGWGNNYDYLEPFTFSPNWGLVYNAHRYWIDPADDWVSDSNPNQINRMANLVAFRNNHQVPVWIGETGENSNEWLSLNIAKLEQEGIGWCHWTYKRHDVGANAALMRIGGNYPTDGASAMAGVLENIKFQNCIPNTSTISAVTQDLPAPWTSGCTGGSTPPPTGCTGAFQGISAAIQAESYCDMNGVQTESTSDTGGGQNVGWIDAGDWLAYRVDIPTTDNYTIEYRVASPGGGGSLQIEPLGGGAAFGSISVSSTGGWQNWTTISHTVSLNAGQQDIALAILAGGFYLNWFKITSQTSGTSAPVGQTIWLRGSNGQYVSSENGQGGMNCNRGAVGGWEQFTVVAVGSNQIALQGNNGQYVNAQNGQSAMTCNSASISGWESFEWVDLGGNNVALLGFGDQYVSSEDGQSAMMCNRASIGGWETFTWSNVSGSRMGFEAEVDLSEKSKVVIYPNPVVDKFIVDLETVGLDNGELSLSDLSGRLILKKSLSNMRSTVKIPFLERGVYLVTIQNAEVKYTQRVVIQ